MDSYTVGSILDNMEVRYVYDGNSYFIVGSPISTYPYVVIYTGMPNYIRLRRIFLTSELHIDASVNDLIDWCCPYMDKLKL